MIEALKRVKKEASFMISQSSGHKLGLLARKSHKISQPFIPGDRLSPHPIDEGQEQKMPELIDRIRKI